MTQKQKKIKLRYYQSPHITQKMQHRDILPIALTLIKIHTSGISTEIIVTNSSRAKNHIRSLLHTLRFNIRFTQDHVLYPTRFPKIGPNSLHISLSPHPKKKKQKKGKQNLCRAVLVPSVTVQITKGLMITGLFLFPPFSERKAKRLEEIKIGDEKGIEKDKR